MQDMVAFQSIISHLSRSAIHILWNHNVSLIITIPYNSNSRLYGHSKFNSTMLGIMTKWLVTSVQMTFVNYSMES